MTRCFAGIALPAAVRDQLHRAVIPWREGGLSGSWAPRDNYHLTLRFYGDLAPEDLDRAGAALAETLQAAAPLRLRLRGFGAFPSLSRAAILWAGVEVVEGELAPWFEAAEKAAWAVGLKPETRPPHPHVTWLRLRERRGAPPDALRELASADFTSDAFSVESVALWESRTGAGPARHTLLKEFPIS